jgi:hypothetical protein
MPVYLGDEHVMMQLDYMLVGDLALTEWRSYLHHSQPISEHPEYYIPPSPSSSLHPDESLFVTPCSSSANLLSHSSSASAKPRLWLHRHKRSPAPRKSPPSSPSDTRIQSLLASLLQARWPKTESEQPIFGQTAPRAVSPSRGKQRPPSAASMPRSILRPESHSSPRTMKSQRSLGCVKFAEQPGVWEYNPPEEEIDDYGVHHPHIEWRTRKDSDGDSTITLPPPGERTHNDSFLKRFIGGPNKHTKSANNDRPTISGPMPLARTASLRQMKEASQSHIELLKEISKGPPKKENKLRSLMGRYLKVS